MRIQRLVPVIVLGIALGIGLAAAQASGQPKPPKPPKPPKSDSHEVKLGSEIAGGGSGPLWIANVPATRTAFATGVLLTTATGQAPQAACSEAHAQLLGVLAAGTPSSGQAAACGQTGATIQADAPAVRSEVVRGLTDAGAPLAEASALADAMAGILSQPRPEQLAESVDRFNRLVMAAPDRFLADPPSQFLAIHAVLARLLGVGTSK